MNSMVENNSDLQEKVAKATIEYLLDHPSFPKSKITSLKGKMGKQFKYNRVIKNATILEIAETLALPSTQLDLLKTKLKRRKTRTLSGVTVIAIMTKPFPCPGQCIYCPGEKSQPDGKAAQSYTGKEPAAMRSIHNHYDPYNQVQSRIKDLEAIGHEVDKIELIIMGGTFLSTPLEYQEDFVKGALEGILGNRYATLAEVKRRVEHSKRRLVGLTIETRPDYCKQEHVDLMLKYGATRVEIGIQTVYDEIYNLVKRGHSTRESINAIRITKDAGLKVNLHVMPNLPGSNFQKDLFLFHTLFSDSNYRPDMLKIYPTVVVKGTELYNWWQSGIYQPYPLEELIELLATVKKNLPPYVRIQRIMRDIPANLIEAGCKKSNLRQLIQHELEQEGSKCNCIRCREFGYLKNSKNYQEDVVRAVNLYRYDYIASQGKEIFLSYELGNRECILGYLRLRIPSKQAHRNELNDGNTSIVREIKIVGMLVPRHSQPHQELQIQHRGLGNSLIQHAEKISKEEFGIQKIAIISGIGVRKWFYKKGYKKDGPYVSKSLL